MPYEFPDVGEEVIALEPNDIHLFESGWDTRMGECVGKVAVVKDVLRNGTRLVLRFDDGQEWYWDTEGVRRVKEPVEPAFKFESVFD